MSAGLAYLVACTCTGRVEPVAFIDDARPAPVGVVVRPVRGDDHVAWIPPARRGELTRSDYAGLSAHAVATTGDMHVVSCPECPNQAQLSSTSLSGFADFLAAQVNTGTFACVEVPEDGSGPRFVGGLMYTPPAGPQKRYVVPLAVLCVILGSRKW